jgi:hypothetical protein
MTSRTALCLHEYGCQHGSTACDRATHDGAGHIAEVGAVEDHLVPGDAPSCGQERQAKTDDRVADDVAGAVDRLEGLGHRRVGHQHRGGQHGGADDEPALFEGKVARVTLNGGHGQGLLKS